MDYLAASGCCCRVELMNSGLASLMAAARVRPRQERFSVIQYFLNLRF